MKTITLFLDINNNKPYTEKELRKLAPDAPESMNLVDLRHKINTEQKYYHIIDCTMAALYVAFLISNAYGYYQWSKGNQ